VGFILRLIRREELEKVHWIGDGKEGYLEQLPINWNVVDEVDRASKA
jgi:hypothetical protein